MAVHCLTGYGMPTPYETAIGSWARRTTFFWAATGATVGLSNLWQFPYLASQHGGGLFVLLYLGCLILVTLPLMLTEAAVGRNARHGVVLAMDGFVRQARLSRYWVWIGRLAIVSAFVVLSFTLVIGAICLAYVFYGALGWFHGGGEAEATGLLLSLVADPGNYRHFMGWHGFFLLLVLWVSAQGVVGGLERTFRGVVPGLLLLTLVLLVYAGQNGDLAGASQQLLGFRREQLGWDSVSLALFHAFFTLGLGMGVWAIFGAYMPAMTPLKRSVFAVVLMDTLFALMAGLVIFALIRVGAPGLGEQGFSLLFVALPLSLADVAGGQFVLAAVFLLVVLVAWTTSLALLEPLVGWFQEWTGSPRGWSVVVMGLAVWLAGLLSLFSFNVWADITWIGGSLFRWLELLASGILIPLVCVSLAIFIGWRLSRPLAFSLIGRTPWLVGQVWYWGMRVVLPLVVAYISVHYTLASVRDLCGEDQNEILCRPVLIHSGAAPLEEAAPETSAESPESELNDAQEASEPGADKGAPEAEPLPPADVRPAMQAPNEKDRQRQDEILYHSV